MPQRSSWLGQRQTPKISRKLIFGVFSHSLLVNPISHAINNRLQRNLSHLSFSSFLYLIIDLSEDWLNVFANWTLLVGLFINMQ